MDLPRLIDRTSATAMLAPVIAAEGFRLLVVVKARFRVDGAGRAKPVRGARVRASDEPWPSEDPSRASVRYPHDLAPEKHGCDVVVIGDSIAPRERPVREQIVRVEIGAMHATVLACGPRTWYASGARAVPTDPLPFTSAPLRWEHAFGGADLSDPAAPMEEPRNPVGRGLARDPATLIGQVVPHVEQTEQRIESHASRPAPAGLGALGPSFEPRRSAAGTHDGVWKRDRMPLPPVDRTADFHRCAVPSLRGGLSGGEQVKLLGLHVEGTVSFALPDRRFAVRGPEGLELPAVLDTVILEPNVLELELTWRASFPWPMASLRHAEVLVREGTP